MKKVLGLTLFLISSFGTFAITENERIQTNLSKIGINQEIIDETKKLVQEMGYKINMNMAQNYEMKMRELLKKDNRNYVVADKLLEYYLISSKDKMNEVEGKEAFESYVNNIPFDLEKNAVSYVYYQVIDNKDEIDKYKNIVFNKYKNTWLVKYYNLENVEDFSEWKKQMENVLKDMDKERNLEKSTVTDELYYEFELKYHTRIIRDNIEKNKISEAINYYVTNVANDMKTSENILQYYREMEILNFNTILALNDNLDEKEAKENLIKLENSRIFKIFSVEK